MYFDVSISFSCVNVYFSLGKIKFKHALYIINSNEKKNNFIKL